MQFNTGEFVWYFSPRKRPGLCGKWQLRTSGPYRIQRRINQVNYVIQKTPGSRPFICHVDRLRRFKGDLPKCWMKSSSNDVPNNMSSDTPATESMTSQPDNLLSFDNAGIGGGATSKHRRPQRKIRLPVRFLNVARRRKL